MRPRPPLFRHLFGDGPHTGFPGGGGGGGVRSRPIRQNDCCGQQSAGDITELDKHRREKRDKRLKLPALWSKLASDVEFYRQIVGQDIDSGTSSTPSRGTRLLACTFARGTGSRCCRGRDAPFRTWSCGPKTSGGLVGQFLRERGFARPPLLFMATDTPAVIDMLSGAMRELLSFNDMALLSFYSDVVIAGMYSSFTQTMPITMICSRHSGTNETTNFCEVSNEGRALTCYDTVANRLTEDPIAHYGTDSKAAKRHCRTFYLPYSVLPPPPPPPFLN